MSSEKLADLILDRARLLVVPGTAFGPGGEQCIRMSFATGEDALRTAVERLGNLFG